MLLADSEPLQTDALLSTLDHLCSGLHAQVSLVRECFALHPGLPKDLQATADTAMCQLGLAINTSRSTVQSVGHQDKAPFLQQESTADADMGLAVRRDEPEQSSDECPVFDSARHNSFLSNDSRAANEARVIVKRPPKEKNLSVDAIKTSLLQGHNHTVPARSRKMSLCEQVLLHDDFFCASAPEKIVVGGVLNPNWWGRLMWDLGVISLVISDAMVLPFQLAYKDDGQNDLFDDVWLWMTTGFFAADILMSFLTAYIGKDMGLAQGRLVTPKAKIARNYICSWFCVDLVSTVPWQILGTEIFGGGVGSAGQVAQSAKSLKFLRFIRLVRMVRLAKLSTIWERVEARLGSFVLKQSVALSRVIVIMFCICHWNACIWWLVGQPDCFFCDGADEEHWTTTEFTGQNNTKWTWQERRPIEQYVFCVYWTLGVMRTMPAEVTPMNLLERLYVMFFMFFAFSAFAICVALITQTFFKFSERSRGMEDEMSAVRMYMRKIKAGAPLQIAVKNFLQFLHEQRAIHAKELAPLQVLPPSLKNMLKHARLQEHLVKLSVFADLPKKAVFYVSEFASLMHFAAGTCLCKKGRRAEAAWVLISGNLYAESAAGMTFSRSGAIDSPQVVDEECLLSSAVVVSPDTVIVAACSEVLKVDKSTFFKRLTQHEDFREVLQDFHGCGFMADSKYVNHDYGEPDEVHEHVTEAVVAAISQ